MIPLTVVTVSLASIEVVRACRWVAAQLRSERRPSTETNKDVEFNELLVDRAMVAMDAARWSSTDA